MTATLISDLYRTCHDGLDRLGFGAPVSGESFSTGDWSARDLGPVRFAWYPDDDRAEVIVFDRPQGNVVYRVTFTGSTPIAVVLAAVGAAIAQVA